MRLTIFPNSIVSDTTYIENIQEFEIEYDKSSNMNMVSFLINGKDIEFFANLEDHFLVESTDIEISSDGSNVMKNPTEQKLKNLLGL